MDTTVEEISIIYSIMPKTQLKFRCSNIKDAVESLPYLTGTY